MNGVRIRYATKKTVWWYPGIARADAALKALEHHGCMPQEMVGDRYKPGGLPVGGHIRAIPLSEMIVEYVTDEGTDRETVEPVTLPNTP